MYFTVYTKLIIEYSLNPIEALIFFYVMSYNANSGSCFQSQGRIAQLFNVSRATVNRSVKALADKHLISVSPYENSDFGLNRLDVTDFDRLYSDLQQGMSKDDTGDVSNYDRGCNKKRYNNYNNNKRNNNGLYNSALEDNQPSFDCDEFFRLAVENTKRKMREELKEYNKEKTTNSSEQNQE